MATNRLANVVPYVVFLSAAAGFAAWIVWDAQKASPHPPGQVGATEPVRPRMGSMLVPADDLVESLEPGMSRIAVEQRFVNQTSVSVEPVDLSSGSPVLRTRYSVYLTRPGLKHAPGETAAFRPGIHNVTLEFDGAAPNHPLLRADVTPGRR